MRSKKVNEITCTTKLQDLMNGKLSLKKNPSFKPKLGMWILLDDGRVGKIIAEDTKSENLKWAVVYQSQYEKILSFCWWPDIKNPEENFISPISALDKTTSFDKLKKAIISSHAWENNVRSLWESWKDREEISWASCVRDSETGGFKKPSAIWRNND